MARVTKVQLEDLAAICYRGRNHSDIPGWVDLEKAHFAPETCARRLVIATKSDAEELGWAIKQKARITTGYEAYEYLLRVTCGLESPIRGEPHIAGQIKKKWVAFQKHNPEQAKAFSTIMRNIFADTKKIRRSILKDDLGLIERETAARSLAEITGRERAILIVGGNQHATTQLAVILGRFGKKSVKEICITHATEKGLIEQVDALEKLKREGKIRSEIDFISLESAASDGFKEFNHVFVCQPMGTNKELDSNLANAWKARLDDKSIRSKGAMVHMQGNPERKGRTTGCWTRLVPEGSFFRPEDVRKEYRRALKEREKTLETADKACTNCTISRFNGKTPVGDFLTLRPEAYRKKLELRQPTKPRVLRNPHTGPSL